MDGPHYESLKRGRNAHGIHDLEGSTCKSHDPLQEDRTRRNSDAHINADAEALTVRLVGIFGGTWSASSQALRVTALHCFLSSEAMKHRI